VWVSKAGKVPNRAARAEETQRGDSCARYVKRAASQVTAPSAHSGRQVGARDPHNKAPVA